MQGLFGRRLNLVSIIITTCIATYVVALLLEPEAITQPRGMLSLLSPGTRALYQLGMTGGIAWQLGWWWTVLTAIYLHGGVLHIVFNVMWIRDLGPLVGDIYGPVRAFLIFEIGGVAGFILSNTMTSVPTIGASGSIFGLLAALIVYGRRRGGTTMTADLWKWAVVLFVLGFMMPGVNNWAHAGGFGGGWVAAYAMKGIDEQRESVTVLLAALALIGVTAIGFLLSFTKVTSILLAG